MPPDTEDGFGEFGRAERPRFLRKIVYIFSFFRFLNFTLVKHLGVAISIPTVQTLC